MAASLAAGLALGLINGLLMKLTRGGSGEGFMITLATGMMAQALAKWYCAGSEIIRIDLPAEIDWFKQLGQGNLLGFPIVYVIVGLVIAVIGGTFIETMQLEDQVEEFIRNGKAIDLPQEELTKKDRLKYAWEQVISTAKKVAPYVLIGVGIGAVIHNWIPEKIIVKVLGTGNPFGVIIATIAGVPMYADIFGCIPIAEALLAKGAWLGVVLSFMMGVTTLSLPSMVMLKKAVKPKLLGIFIAICTIGIIVVGYFFNAIQYLVL